jgi:general stress protein YciG
MKPKTPKQIISEHYAKIGRKGGKAKSKAKGETARENGKRGGRPRKAV